MLVLRNGYTSTIFLPVYPFSNSKKLVAAAETAPLSTLPEIYPTSGFSPQEGELNLDTVTYWSITLRWDFTVQVLKVSKIILTKSNVLSY